MTPGIAGESAADEPTAPQTAREPTSALVTGEPATAGTAGQPAAATTVAVPAAADTAGAAREVVAAVAGDQSAFAVLSQRYRRELHVHCYRMLGSFDDAEDAVQEAFLRAWRGRDGFDGGTMFRAWLYRIATNVCLDMLRRRAHRTTVLRSFAEVPWLQPYPDRLLDEATAPGEQQPDAAVIERETIELAFVAALQILPPRQRATLIARDVLGWPASQTAVLLEMSVAAANSALQRARATMREHLPAHRSDWSGRSAGQLSDAERDLLDRFIDAHQRCDAAAAVAIAAQDIRITMPPYSMCYDGVSAMGLLLERAFGPDRDGDWRLLPTAANRMPAAATYLRRPGDSKFRAFKLDVLRTGDGVIAEITTFGASLFPAFGLPGTLGPGAR
ncbi:MAG TPA: RNA polymerase subunit sigma-70 [Streptosporangiaceae bacterium]|nr:RNA polymerase subunit sigma-70 [Streptosporangiaceae bacterium]